LTSNLLDSSVQSTPWSVLLDGYQSGPFNMALDETLLDEVSKPQAHPQTYLRLYQWMRPTVSLGFSQKAERVVDLDYCSAHGIDVVRRPTGGKAVLHHRELTYSVISNDAAVFPIGDISKTYRRIAYALQKGLGILGVETTLAQGCGRSTAMGPLPAACFAVSNHFEVLWQNRKLVGSAQRRTKTAFLQHGSILIEFDAEMLSGTLRSCDVASVSAVVTDLKTCLGSIPPMHDLIRAMSKGFEESFAVPLVNHQLRQDLSARAHKLADAKCTLLSRPSAAANEAT
jgi:lipoyl(octanoyl) transferase